MFWTREMLEPFLRGGGRFWAHWIYPETVRGEIDGGLMISALERGGMQVAFDTAVAPGEPVRGPIAVSSYAFEVHSIGLGQLLFVEKGKDDDHRKMLVLTPPPDLLDLLAGQAVAVAEAASNDRCG